MEIIQVPVNLPKYTPLPHVCPYVVIGLWISDFIILGTSYSSSHTFVERVHFQRGSVIHHDPSLKLSRISNLFDTRILSLAVELFSHQKVQNMKWKITFTAK